ncbi:helix-turn-helix domain-containing protein [Nocardia vinacea]|uniref:helix-turn-helix domain-containing protein n=1 Tax=Nocardia vinacea TaxID=96468 RepID=UPI0002DABE9A|nr:helix-turn-helix domain-containing protein [Nocardia vinacea]
MSDLLSAAGQLPDHPETDPAEIFDRLLDSARTVIAREGFGSLTVQAIARQAGVNLSSAHAYFGCDAQLISEVLWRQLISVPRARAISGHMNSGSGHDVRSDALDVLRLRARTAGEIQRRIRAALGPLPDTTIIQNLEAIYTAALFDAATWYAADSRGERSPEQLVQRILDRR